MSRPLPPKPAKLIIGMFTADRPLVAEAAGRLIERLGEIDMVSPWFDFNYTAYYEKEMGRPLMRRLLVFKRLIDQQDLADIKWLCLKLEDTFSAQGNRRINIDPGYLLAERFVLASGKNFTHRVYIGRRIYADLTLTFTRNDFHCLPWTYPDYASRGMRDYLLQVRDKYLFDLKNNGSK